MTQTSKVFALASVALLWSCKGDFNLGYQAPPINTATTSGASGSSSGSPSTSTASTGGSGSTGARGPAPQVMLVIDRSGSMTDAASLDPSQSCTSSTQCYAGQGVGNCKWNNLLDVMVNGVGSTPSFIELLTQPQFPQGTSIQLGLTYFSGDTMPCSGSDTLADECSVGVVAVPIGADAGSAIEKSLLSMVPAGGTPSAATMSLLPAAFPAPNPALAVQPQKYAILITDGAPNCNANIQPTAANCGADRCTLDTATNSCATWDATCPCWFSGSPIPSTCLDETGLVDAVQSLRSNGIKTFVIGFGLENGGGGLGASVETLNQAALAGGVAQDGGANPPGSFTYYYSASSESDLQEILAQIGDVLMGGSGTDSTGTASTGVTSIASAASGTSGTTATSVTGASSTAATSASGSPTSSGTTGAGRTSTSVGSTGATGSTSSTGSTLPPQVMLVVDRSGSMTDSASLDPSQTCTDPNQCYAGQGVGNCKWNNLLDVMVNGVGSSPSFIERMTQSQSGTPLQLGLTYFSGDTMACSSSDTLADECSVGVVAVPMSADAGAAIESSLLAIIPSGGTPSSATMSLLPAAFPGANPGLSNQPDKYAILITDGAPNCNGNIQPTAANCGGDRCTLDSASNACATWDATCPCWFSNSPIPQTCLDETGLVSAIQSLRTVNGIKTFVVGFGLENGGGPLGASIDTLNQAALAGGVAQDGGPTPASGFTYYYSATSESDLQSILSQIGDVLIGTGQGVSSTGATSTVSSSGTATGASTTSGSSGGGIGTAGSTGATGTLCVAGTFGQQTIVPPGANCFEGCQCCGATCLCGDNPACPSVDGGPVRVVDGGARAGMACGDGGLVCSSDQFCEHLNFHGPDASDDAWTCIEVPACDQSPTCACFAVAGPSYCDQPSPYFCDTSSGALLCEGSSP